MKKIFAFVLALLLCGCSDPVENTFFTISSYLEEHAHVYKETYMPHHYFNDQNPLTTLSQEDLVTVYCIGGQKHVYHMLFDVEGITVAYWFNHSEDVEYRYFIEQGDYRYYYIKEYNLVSVMYSDENLDMCIDLTEYDHLNFKQDELIQIGINILHDTILANK